MVLFLYKYQALPIYTRAIVSALSESQSFRMPFSWGSLFFFLPFFLFKIEKSKASKLCCRTTTERKYAPQIRLCHRETTTWSLWGICHSCSSSHIGHYLQDVAAWKFKMHQTESLYHLKIKKQVKWENLFSQGHFHKFIWFTPLKKWRVHLFKLLSFFLQNRTGNFTEF